MKAVRRLFLVLLVFAVAAAIGIATCPATLAWRYVAARAGAVQIDGISGSVWNGHAQTLRVVGHPLGAFDWQLAVLPLLHRKLQASVQLHGEQMQAQGLLTRYADGSLEIADATASLPASIAAPALDIPLLQLLGTLDVHVANLRLQGAWPTHAQGNIQWRDAAVAGAAQAQLGRLRADFATAPDGSIAGTVHDEGGALQLNGTFVVREGNYDARATLASRDGNAQVQEALRYIGQPQADGTTLLLIHGRLFGVF